MSNLRIPSRRAPTGEDARRLQNNKNQGVKTKIPPPRPPPPNFALAKSKSAWSLSPTENTISLIEWSPPTSPKQVYNTHSRFNGSISSSFSSSTSSLASSKKSYEFDSCSDWLQMSNGTFYPKQSSNSSTITLMSCNNTGNVSTSKIGPGPTIIRAAPPKKKNLRPTASASTSREVSPLPPYFHSGLLAPVRVDDVEKGTDVGVDGSSSPPMPSVPPPSPPKDVQDVVVPFGIALFDYDTKQEGDLQFTVNDVIYLVKYINNDWIMGRTIDERQGIFPSSFIDIQVPLKQDSTSPKSPVSTVQALYDFDTNIASDLCFKAGDSINVIRIIDSNWCEGECQGRRGQFPSNFVDRVPIL